MASRKRANTPVKACNRLVVDLIHIMLNADIQGAHTACDLLGSSHGPQIWMLVYTLAITDKNKKDGK